MTKGQRIAELRKRKNESQSELAKVVHVSASTIGMWETDQRAIKDNDLSTLADHFGVTTDYILGRKIDLGDTPVAAHLRNGLSLDDLPEDRRQAVIDYMEYQKSLYKKEQERKGKKD
ncbi:helix-turn-helix domain-containing protein [Levilactobacillus brevis]|mgnify:FL=1|uniref:Helix-turn-helix transcriptional regulator n=1 Tax=Levilactobacillus brevis TaxID=1580 RepID=A0AB38X7K5_LEVBR|nr:helix-turn-helix transcriptional regulator [Levilactobacillus brevis]MCM6799466.1 helix-turn-helix domain-containing protein [Levilactobacillus brevis]MCM6801835.1 helix-turn-helix domain-containing protein [Levilactobacillus brevis]MCM6804924.1 helix-turn-helix domain-containing protein [Levilactobacillus brevis]MCM6807508.1 helix-turn-helix domain-containing protein [Levilactobacillus brevis]MCM6813392.1 helix-turn-helix domain-containing protein [Levilactobacillus brevis]